MLALGECLADTGKLEEARERVESAYASWPSRVFVIGTDGRILYSSGLSQLDFRAEAMAKALQSVTASK
jgi:hypothetical protein